MITFALVIFAALKGLPAKEVNKPSDYANMPRSDDKNKMSCVITSALMKMNDPFGRVTQRQEGQYASLKETLKRTGVDNEETAKLCLKSMLVNAARLALVIVVATIVAVLLLPKMKPIALTFAGLALFWVVTSSLNGRRFVKRYMKEELGLNE